MIKQQFIFHANFSELIVLLLLVLSLTNVISIPLWALFVVYVFALCTITYLCGDDVYRYVGNKKNTFQSSIGLLISVILIVLKLSSIAEISWWIVFAPWMLYNVIGIVSAFFIKD